MRRWTIGVVVALALVAGACGGGGSKKASSTGTTEAGKTATSQASSSGGGEFCTRAADYSKRYTDTFAKDIQAVIANPGSAEARATFKSDFEAVRSAAKDLVSKAPSQIKADMDLVLSAFDQLFNALSSVDFDFAKLAQSNPQLLSSLQDPKFQAAATRLGTYFTDTCHITTTTARPG
jgi:Flp pilus assembly protein TadD